MTPDLLDLFNFLSFIIFVGLVFLIFARLTWRWRLFRRFKKRIPSLLKRDVIMFGSIVLFLGSTFIVLIFNIQGLRTNPFWIIPRAVISLGALAYWCWVEYHLEEYSETVLPPKSGGDDGL